MGVTGSVFPVEKTECDLSAPGVLGAYKAAAFTPAVSAPGL